MQISTLQGQLDEAKAHAAQLKANNKTVRDELRKVQSSVQLLERQRNPGVGYWSAAGSAGPSRSGLASPESIATPSKELRRSLEHVAETQSTRTSSPAPSERGKEEEEVNLEVGFHSGDSHPTVSSQCHPSVPGEQGDARKSDPLWPYR